MAVENVNKDVVPLRAVIIVDMAATVSEGQAITNAVIEDAEKRGVFLHYVTLSELDPADVVTFSPLHEALTGEPANG